MKLVNKLGLAKRLNIAILNHSVAEIVLNPDIITSFVVHVKANITCLFLRTTDLSFLSFGAENSVGHN